jgi:2-polyprenyl-3-methyl-5-hydroxy-6-metoxy-1,4-benzoquinol methylase
MENLLDFDPSRKLKAQKILSILQDFLGPSLHKCRGLDVGCANGAITRELASSFLYLVGSDVDRRAIDKARRIDLPNLSFIVSDGSQLSILDGSIDVVVCAQVYEHAENQQGLADEIWRVLRPGGVCFFSGPNRLAIMEEHYWLPFLSWLPRSLSNIYMRIMKRGPEYDIKPMYSWQTRKLWRRFEKYDYIEQILSNTQKYSMEKTIGFLAPILRNLPAVFLGGAKILIPNYNWILVKPNEPRS